MNNSTTPTQDVTHDQWFRFFAPTGILNVSWGKAPINHGTFTDPADVERQFNEAQARQESFWFRVNVAERGTGGSGSVQDSDIILYIALPIDIDLPPSLKHAPIEERNNWRDSGVKILDAGDVIPRPSLIVSSGNGLAAYLLLDKPMQLNPDEYRAVVGGIAATLKQAGFDTSDPKIINPSRLMRYPFGRNYKAALPDGSYPEAKVLKVNA